MKLSRVLLLIFFLFNFFTALSQSHEIEVGQKIYSHKAAVIHYSSVQSGMNQVITFKVMPRDRELFDSDADEIKQAMETTEAVSKVDFNKDTQKFTVYASPGTDLSHLRWAVDNTNSRELTNDDR